MAYSQICPACGFHSDAGQANCPKCGAEKMVELDESSASDLISEDIDSHITGIEHSSVYIKIFISGVILLAGIFLLPDFIRKSEFFWMLYVISTIFTVIKAIDEHFLRLQGIYFLARILLWAYIGAGMGNVISFTGRHTVFSFSYFFNPEFLYEQFLSKNGLAISGFFAGIICFFLIRYFSKMLKE
jgi:uncharacterized protein (DUF983 family)